MSYASVAAHNAPPPSQQPRPDPALLNTEPPSADNMVDDMTRVRLVAPDFTLQPPTAEPNRGAEDADMSTSPYSGLPQDRPAKRHSARDKAKERIHDVEEEGSRFWKVTKSYLFRPEVAGGLLGVVNIGVISGVGYTFYACPHVRRDAKVLGSTAAGLLTLFGAEGYLVETYHSSSATSKGNRDPTGSLSLYDWTHEKLWRPRLLGGSLGIVNGGVLVGLGYLAYANRDAPHWDRRVVSGIVATLATLWMGEEYLNERYQGRGN